MHEDAQAIEAIKNGDRDRYAELVDRYQRLVYGIAWSRLGDAALCDDAVQETFVRGFQFLGALRRPETFAAWIGRVARSIANSMERRERRHLSVLRKWQIEKRTDENPEPVDSSDSALSEALQNLGAAHREALVLFYIQDNSIRDCAEALGISQEAFKTRLHRARVALRAELEAQLEPALRRLAPGTESKSRVLAAMPASPIGFAKTPAASSSLLAAVEWFSGTVLLPLLFPLLMLLQLSWFYRSTTSNCRAGGEFRSRLIRSNFILLMLLAPFIFLTSGIAVSIYGQRTLLLLIAIYLFPCVIQSLFTLRVNRNPAYIAMTRGLHLMLLALLALSAEIIPQEAFLLCVSVYSCGIAFTRKHMPNRADYSLFLRASLSRLGDPGPEAIPCLPQSEDELKAFAQMLGTHWLIVDRATKPSGMRFYLPHVRNSVIASFLLPIPRWTDSSSITIAHDGRCSASLSRTDALQIRPLAPEIWARRTELEQKVSAAIAAGFARFQSGDHAGALQLLQPEPDEAIFIRPPHTLLATRVNDILTLALPIAMVVILIIYLARH